MATRPNTVASRGDGDRPDEDHSTDLAAAPNAVSPSDDAGTEPAPPASGSGSPYLVAWIDEQLQAGWEEAGVRPSPAAADHEWIRRVYLDIAGHIPPAGTVEAFLSDRNPDKHALLVEKLLDDPAYVRNWTTIWTNLLIGRSDARGVNRQALQRFLRDGFGRNLPWSEMVVDLVAAEGDADRNGAANYLLAHLNNEALPATAITARVFLGTQMHCTQCHHHPHPANKARQEQFWELHGFFQNTEVVHRRETDPRTGRPVVRTELVSRNEGGPTFFERSDGLMRAAYPQFAGRRIDPGPEVYRRGELARLMLEGENPAVAQAMVNRTWDHFFGAAFTRPVDDMGPHNPPTHPELLDRLSREFVRSGYDLKQLVRWICGTEAYRLSSRFNDTNHIDDPDAGDLPLFSRVYVKPMTAEQLYDSLLVATRAHLAGRSDWESVERQRQHWLQQFVVAFENDENAEATTFDGTILQALMRMNGELVEGAVSGAEGTYLYEVLAERSPETEKLRKLSLATLSRPPTPQELAAFRRLLREQSSSRGPNRQAATAEALRDVFWAYLNSGEFVLIH